MENPLIPALKKINSFPVPFTIRHYYAFGKKNKALEGICADTPEAWDTLREDPRNTARAVFCGGHIQTFLGDKIFQSSVSGTD